MLNPPELSPWGSLSEPAAVFGSRTDISLLYFSTENFRGGVGGGERVYAGK